MYITVPIKLAYFVLGCVSMLIFIIVSCIIIVNNENKKRDDKAKELLDFLSKVKDKGDE